MLRRAFAFVASAPNISPQCHRFTVPLLCYQSFQVCEPRTEPLDDLPELGINGERSFDRTTKDNIRYGKYVEMENTETMYHSNQPFHFRQVYKIILIY